MSVVASKAKNSPKLLPKLMVGCALPVLAGCGANYNSIYRADEIGGKTLLISQDAKQRVVLRAERPGDAPGATRWATCVEPPPDVFSVLAASTSGNFSSPEGTAAAIAQATSETGANIGLRTQSIQLLRDQAFRICESYANGAVNELDYAQLLRRNQVMLTAVLAIEQLTGTVVGPSAAIGASSSVEVDQAAVQKANEDRQKLEGEVGTQQGVVDAKKQALVAQETAVKDKQAKADAAKKAVETAATGTPADQQTAAANLTAAQNELKAAQEAQLKARQELAAEEGTLKGKRDALAAAKQAVERAANPDLKTANTSMLQGATVVTKDVAPVAIAVQNIVQMAFLKQHILDFCQMYWSGKLEKTIYETDKAAAKTEGRGSLKTVCSDVLYSWLKTVDALTAAYLGNAAGGAASVQKTPPAAAPSGAAAPAPPPVSPGVVYRGAIPGS